MTKKRNVQPDDEQKNRREAHAGELSAGVHFPEGLTINYPEYPIKHEDVMNEQNEQKKSRGGRPTKYKPEYASQAEKLCLLGATDAEMAAFFEIDEANLNKWKKKFPEFRESIKRGKMYADANVTTRLYQKCLGYEHDDVDIRVVKGKIVQTKVRKHYPPDTLAIIYFLNNRQPNKWKQKQDITHKLGDGKITVKISKPKRAEEKK